MPFANKEETMQNNKVVVAILLGIGLVFVLFYWFASIPIFGVIGYASLCLGNGLAILNSILDKKGRRKTINKPKDDLSH
jgi:hypothetical protein